MGCEHVNAVGKFASLKITFAEFLTLKAFLGQDREPHLHSWMKQRVLMALCQL
jgi:hypothetical protein